MTASGEATQRCRLLFADQLNLARGKYVPLSEARKGHARLCVGAYAVTYCKDMIAAPGAGVLDGLPDMQLVFDPANLRMSWERDTQVVVGDLRDGDTDFPLCGRSALKRAIALWRDRGLEPQIGIEMEAYVYQRNADGEWVPYETPGAFVYGTGPFSDPAGLVDDIWQAAANCGLPIESINAEFDSPQFELTLRYADALKAADDAFLFRQMAREILFKRGYLLSFLPKPIEGKSGSGLHFNLSFTDKDGTNVFARSDVNDTSNPVMQGVIAGMLKHHRALTGVLAPVTNSYERLKPGNLVGYWANWGVDHRSVTVRLSGETGNGARLEHRLGDCAASPYFAIAALLQAGHLGMENSYALPDPETEDGIESVSAEEHAPHDLGSALDALESDTALTEAIGSVLVANYVAIKRREIELLADKSREEQIAYYLHYI
ncbi:glutamine synthetase family protein [Aurantiacibacter rhizosphaerae]|uniref:glutamine synthetase family protein n=1 Tax=Aurantiacibacter rhizosphaerae TaxID=2691582 RepID=UPI00301D48FA